MFKVPVVVIIFNRPELARRLVDAMGLIRPTEIYLISDGPRNGVVGEQEKVQSSREIFNSLSWDCKVATNFAPENMGCMERIASGLDWVFGKVDRAIILEDDCIPSRSFFLYCEELLDLYQSDDRVLSISGTRLAPEIDMRSDYCFSKYAFCWGWATWGRAWKKFDKGMAAYEGIRDTNFLREKLGGRRQEIYWRYVLDKVMRGAIDSWAYRWTFAHWLNDGLSAVPRVNLVSNRGVGVTATNTTEKTQWLETEAGSLRFPLQTLNEVSPDAFFDGWVEDNVFSKSLWIRINWSTNWLKTRVRALFGS